MIRTLLGRVLDPENGSPEDEEVVEAHPAKTKHVSRRAAPA